MQAKYHEPPLVCHSKLFNTSCCITSSSKNMKKMKFIREDMVKASIEGCYTGCTNRDSAFSNCCLATWWLPWSVAETIRLPCQTQTHQLIWKKEWGKEKEEEEENEIRKVKKWEPTRMTDGVRLRINAIPPPMIMRSALPRRLHINFIMKFSTRRVGMVRE